LWVGVTLIFAKRSDLMFVGALRMTLQLPDSHSLKDKRQVVRSLVTRTRGEFHVAAAEVGDTERWQIAELGFACVSESSGHVYDILARVERFIYDVRPDLVVLESTTDTMSLE
jgi:uncharacterized protein YlxP (DUF503 family)